MLRGARSVFFVIGALLLVTAAVVQAQSFVKPSGPAPDNTADLNVFTTDTGDFISLTQLNPAQTINSSLVIASSTQSSAIIGDYARNVSLSGFAGITVPPITPPDLPAGVPGAAVYGYAKGSALLNVGAYGYVVGAAATDAGVFATTQSGVSVSFLGPVKITTGSLPGSLLIKGELTVPHADFSSNDVLVPAGLKSTNGTLIEGTFNEGLYGYTSGEYGIYGVSTTNTGFRLVNGNTISGDGQQTRYGIYGQSNNLTQFAGVYGSVASGNGVAGISGTGVTSWAVYGFATQSWPGADGKGSSAVYGRGGAYAGYFEGDLTIDNTGQPSRAFFLGSKGITEDQLKQLLAWCNDSAGVGDKCPDP